MESAIISTVYVVAVQSVSNDSSIFGKTSLPLCALLSGANNICVPEIPSEVTSTLVNWSNSWVVKFDVPLTITSVNLSVAASNPSIVTVYAPSSDTPELETSYLNSSAAEVAVTVVSSEAEILTTVYDAAGVSSVVVSSVVVSSVVVSSAGVSSAAGAGAASSPIDEPKTIFRVLSLSTTPSRVKVELLPSASGAK